MTVPESDPTVVDVAFDVEGTSLPADHAWPLQLAIESRLPWLPGEALAGIHPLRAAATTYGVVLLAQRAKLVLRLPAARLPDALLLEDATLEVGGSPLRIGAGMERGAARPARRCPRSASPATRPTPPRSRPTSSARCRRMGVACRFISGRRRQGQAGGRAVAGFALSLHGLGPADSLLIQREGMGGDRRLGWGLFVPAKTIVAADE